MRYLLYNNIELDKVMAESTKGMKTCYYELLGVDKDATQKDIEKVCLLSIV